MRRRYTLLTAPGPRDIVSGAIGMLECTPDGVPSGDPEQWHSDSMELLRAAYGEQHVHVVLERTNRWLRTDRELVTALHLSGLGSHPTIVMQCAMYLVPRGPRIK